MNDKEAVKMLRTIQETVYLGSVKFYEAIDVAIKTLEHPMRKKGKWIDGSIPTYAVCSECGYQERYAYENNFCPNCGADMRGG